MASPNAQDRKASSPTTIADNGLSTSSPSGLPSALRKPTTSSRAGDSDVESNSETAKPPRKSVSFPNLVGEEPGTMALPSERHQHDDHESSADEHTGMLSARRDSGRDYASVDGPSSRASRATGVERIEGVPVKKRNAQKAREDPADESKKGWWSNLLAKYGSVELENKGSVARDHLALERTFLAWLRTSLSFASIGIAVTQLFRLNTSIGAIDPKQPTINHLRKVGKPLGAAFIGIAIFVLFFGFHRYFESQHYIIRGKFPASRGSILMVTLSAFTLSVTSLVIVLIIGGSSLEAPSGT